MATNENRAAALAVANGTPVAAPVAVAAAPAVVTPPAAAAAPAEPAAVVEEPKTGKVPWTEWDTVKKEKGKAKAREERAAAIIAESEAKVAAAAAEVERMKGHPVFSALSKKDLALAVREYAKAENITFQKAIDQLGFQVLNDGKRPPEELIAEVDAKVSKIETDRVAAEAERTKQSEAAQTAANKAAFVQFTKRPEVAAKFPLLAVESAADVAEASYVVAKRMKEERGAWPDSIEVAAELEASAKAYYAGKRTAFEKFLELSGSPGQATGKPGDAASPELAEGTGDLQPEGGATPVRTLTNGTAARRGPPAELKTREDRRRAAMKLLG